VHATEARALGVVAADLVAEVVSLTEGVHRVIAAYTPAGQLQGVITRTVYAGVRHGLRLGALGAGQVAGLVKDGAPTRSVSESPRGATAVGVLAGFIGTELEERGLPLAPVMTLVPQEAPDGAGERIVVFVHGLVETERSWWRTSRGHQPMPSYGDRLADRGWTPLYVRYNTGAPVDVNAQRLADLLTRTVEHWPVPVREIALVGHSMGGMVARGAAALGAPHVTEIVSLGSPHLGAPLATGTASLVALAQRMPEVRPVAAVLHRRSRGIRDLEARRCAERRHPARHTAVAVTLASRPSSRLGRVLGDGLVREPSACADADVVHVLGGMNHFDVLNHPAVWPCLRDVLARR
jgi:pimeloyl-ACP methyl ester carboxylesterase